MQHPLVPGVALDAYGLVASRQLADGRWACVSPLLFGRAQLAVTRDAGASAHAALAVADGGSYAEVWHYDTLAAAIAAMVTWAAFGGAAPRGWTRRVGDDDGGA